jgi:hypothetical protein
MPVARVGSTPAARATAVSSAAQLAPAAPRYLWLVWDRCDDPAAWYEFASTTNLGQPNSWYFKLRVPPTNRVAVATTQPREFFVIRSAWPVLIGPTNQPVTNWIYSAYAGQ